MANELQPPAVSLNPLDFGSLPQGSSFTLKELIGNPSKNPLLWRGDNGGASWLTLKPSYGTLEVGKEQPVDVTVDTSSLAVGGYEATLIFTSEGDNLSASVNVLVTLVISPVLTPAAGLSFGTLFWNSSRTLPLLVCNRDSRTVDWTVVTGGTSWLKLNRSAGTLQPNEQQTIFVTVNSSSLAGGGYAATLTLTSEALGIKSAGVQIPVDLHVGPLPYSDDGPHIRVRGVEPYSDDGIKSPLYTPALNFGTQQQEGTQIQDESNTLPLLITNPNENGQVDWTLDTGGVIWLTLDPSAGTLQAGKQQQVKVTANKKSDLRPGTYRADFILTFTFDDPRKASREPTSVLIPVTMTVP
jgi:hypothetical protein